MNMIEPANAWNWRQSQIMHCLTFGESTAPPLGDPARYAVPSDGVLALKTAPDSPYIRYGFAEYKPWGMWIVPPRSGLVVTLPRQESVSIQVLLATQAFAFDPTRIGVFWNGHRVGEMVVDRKDLEVVESPAFAVPKDITSAGINRIELRVSRAYYGVAAATEPLGAAMHSIIIRPR